MTQAEQILAALRSRPVTAMDALREFGCFRLAARINDLRGLGHNIQTDLIETEGGARVARYTLTPPKGPEKHEDAGE